MIAIGCDHGGFELKEQIKIWLAEKNLAVEDMGCRDLQSVDYPDFARKVAEAVSEKKAERGILICGTGIGMSIAANRVRGVRATLVHDGFTARMSRMHNDSNVLCLGARVLGVEIARDCLEVWLETDFEGDRHQGRLNKIEDLCRG